MKIAFRTLAFVSVVLSAGSAHAFTEDVCYLSTGGVEDCTPLPAACKPAGKQDDPCLAAAALTYAGTTTKGYLGARSTIHTDAVYIMAQAVGFPQVDAYWMAAYNEATDLGTFQPLLTTTGQPVKSDGSLTTASVSGLERTDFASGGIFVHYSTPRNPNAAAPVPGIDGLHPNALDDVHEVLLANLRTWAVTGTGNSHPECTMGLTNLSSNNDNATGTTCYSNGGAPGSINASIALLDGENAAQMDASVASFSVPTGLQIVQDPDAGPSMNANSFDQIVGTDPVGNTPTHISDARIGIYIHALGDRTSHHVCLDNGYLFGPEDAGVNWEANMSNPQCGQGLHALRHIWESGVQYSSLDVEDQTTPNYLGNAYDELIQFATARGVLSPKAPAKKDIVAALSNAISTTGAQARLDQLNQVTCGYGLVAFPGTTPCPSTGTDAGAADSGTAGSGADAGVTSHVDGGSGEKADEDDAGNSKGGCTTSPSDASSAAGGFVLLGVGIIGAWIARRRNQKAI